MAGAQGAGKGGGQESRLVGCEPGRGPSHQEPQLEACIRGRLEGMSGWAAGGREYQQGDLTGHSDGSSCPLEPPQSLILPSELPADFADLKISQGCAHSQHSSSPTFCFLLAGDLRQVL